MNGYIGSYDSVLRAVLEYVLNVNIILAQIAYGRRIFANKEGVSEKGVL